MPVRVSPPSVARVKGRVAAVSRYPIERSTTVFALILWIIAVILVISGIVQLFRGEAILGIVLIVVGLLVGPGGVSIFT